MQNRILKHIKSYVLREGRMTIAQQRAFEEQWPKFGIPLQEQLLDFTTTFQREAPVILDIGFGMGHSLAGAAQQHPERNFLGVEVFKTGIGALLAQVAEHQLTNIRVIHGDAVLALQNMIPHASLDRVQIFFPDPWPKKRHHKRRLIQKAFVEDLVHKLKPEGILHIATDWPDYALHISEVIAQVQTLHDCTHTTLGQKIIAERPRTKYQHRGERLGHPIQEWVLIKT